MPLKTLFLWHAAQACVVWTPASGNVVWTNVAPCHVGAEGLWQPVQSVGKPPATWLGFWTRS